MEESRGAYKALLGNPEVKSLNVHGRIILILSSRSWMGDMDWVDLV